MQTLYVPKYNLHYRVNPRNPRELQWSRKPFGPATQWQHAMSFKNPIRALDLDDETKQGVVVLNDSTTYVGSGVRTWGRKFYPAGTRIYSLYAIGESKMKHKLKIKVNEGKRELRNNLYNALKPINGKFYSKSRSVLALDDFKRIMDETLPDNLHYTLGSLHDGMKLDRNGSGHFWFEFPFSVQENDTMKEVLSGLITLSPAGTEEDPMHRYDTTIQIF